MNSSVLRCCNREEGSVLPLVLVVVVALAVGAVGVARLGQAASSQAQAQLAADAAALAGARIDRGEAVRLAELNGARLTGWSEEFVGGSHRVDVAVVLDDSTASASARWDPPPTLPPLPSTSTTTSTVPDGASSVIDTTVMPVSPGPGPG
jgi:hypothetical protein